MERAAVNCELQLGDLEMDPDNARDAAFCLEIAVRHLRKYAVLMEHGIERPINLELALNNIRFGLENLGMFVTSTATPEELHRRMRKGAEHADADLALSR